jgi:hypothetical protein
VTPEIDLSKLTVAEKDALILSLLRKRCSVTLEAAAVSQGGCWGAQCQGISSSMRSWGQPFTRRVSRSVMYA